MRIPAIIAATIVLTMGITVHGEAGPQSESSTPPEVAPNKYQGEGGWLTWPKMTGDWGGARTGLAEHGIDIDLRLTQFYQGVASGGANTNFAYGGKLDYILNIDGKKLGLWNGLLVTMHAETQFGESINGDVGAFAALICTVTVCSVQCPYQRVDPASDRFLRVIHILPGHLLGRAKDYDCYDLLARLGVYGFHLYRSAAWPIALQPLFHVEPNMCSFLDIGDGSSQAEHARSWGIDYRISLREPSG